LRFLGDEEGRVKGIRTVHVDWKKDAQGRMVPVNIPGTEQNLPAQIVLLAMGFIGPDHTIVDQLEVQRDALQRTGLRQIRPM
jgi:glutamate synthase (NADPH/NADH) small chain